MTARDIALIAYRVLALWIGVSGLMALIETLLSWESIVAQTMATMAAVSNAPTERAFFWMTTSALGARALFGFLLWWAAPALARRTPVSESHGAAESSRHALYSAAAFLVGLVGFRVASWFGVHLPCRHPAGRAGVRRRLRRSAPRSAARPVSVGRSVYTGWLARRPGDLEPGRQVWRRGATWRLTMR